MNLATPRLRVFAGPNGSGKSTLKAVVPSELLGIYLNPDEIEAEIKRSGSLNITNYGISGTLAEILAFFGQSRLLAAPALQAAVRHLCLRDDRLEFPGIEINSYWASVTAAFLQQKLLRQRTSFTIETVMSHPGKVALLQTARQAGYRTYLYFIATDDPAINISRVRNRVKLGGHAVPEDKITPRYQRSLELLPDAVRVTNRAYIFDNSGGQGAPTWLAEITEGKTLELKTGSVPAWFKRSLLDPLGIS